jgi:hypothetical protein
MEEVKIGRVYRHFKGNYYFVEGVALDSETKERMVVYKPLYARSDSNIWVRREKMFLEEVPVDRPDNITGQNIRFKLCEDIEKDYTK